MRDPRQEARRSSDFQDQVQHGGCRGFLIKRIFVPNWKVCLPLVQDRSSTKLCTGVWKELLRVTASSELLAPSSSFSPRKKTNGWLSLLPILPKLCRVKPQWKLLTSVGPNSAV